MASASRQHNSLPNARMLFFTIMALLGWAVAMAEIYTLLARYVGSPWLSALIVHTIFVSSLWGIQQGWIDSVNFEFTKALWRSYPNLKRPTYQYFAPAIIIIVGALVLATVSQLFGEGTSTSKLGSEQFAFVAVVPLVEEGVYRWGIGAFLRRRVGVLSGAYLNSLLFSFMHSQPTLNRLLDGQAGFVLGPFLLGLICEAIYIVGGRLGPAVACHMACNATVVIFALIDERWLDWLGLLYIS